jgi:hypothetical protein
MSSASNRILLFDGKEIQDITGLHFDHSVHSLYDACTDYFEGPGVNGEPRDGGLIELFDSCVANGGDINAAVSGAPWERDAMPPLNLLLSFLHPPNPHQTLRHWHHRSHGRSSDDDSDEEEDPAGYCCKCRALKPVIRNEILGGIQWLLARGVNTNSVPNFEETLSHLTKYIDRWVKSEAP